MGGTVPFSGGDARRGRPPLATIAVAVLLAGTGAWLLPPLEAVLELDFRALMDSLRATAYQAPVLADAWTDRGVAALRLGALPLLALLWAGAVLRVRARERPGSRTLGHLPRSARALLALGALAPLAAFAVPAALALSTWLVVEAFPWVQWYDRLEKMAEPVVTATAPLLFLGLLLAGVAAAAAVLRRPADPGAARPGAARRALRRAAGIALALPLAVPALGVAIHGARVLPVAGSAREVAATCGTCHEATAPLFYVRTPDEWRHTLEATCFHARPLEQEQREQVLEFLEGMRSFPDAWVFRTRCQRCHGAGTLLWEDRSPEDWAAIVDRLGRRSPFYYGEPYRAQVVRHLAATRGREDRDPGEAALGRAIRACTACHPFDRNADRWREAPASEAAALVRRMSDRMEAPLPEGDLADVAARWQEALRDPEALRRRIPHDRPVPEGVLPW